MQKALCCLGDVPYCFSRLSVKFQGHTAQNSSILTKIGRFRTVTPVWINLWLQNDAQRLKQHRRGALILFKVIRQNFKVTGGKIGDVDPIWGFLDCNWSLNSLMALKLWTKLNVVYKRCLIIFTVIYQISRSHRTKNLPIFTQIGLFQTVAPVWIR